MPAIQNLPGPLADPQPTDLVVVCDDPAGGAVATKMALAVLAAFVYPVGSIYVAADGVSPATKFGFGTWAEIAGRFLVGHDAAQAEFDALGATGGAKAVTLTAAQSGLPQHTHLQTAHTHTQSVNTATTGGLSGYAPDTSTNNSATSGYSTGSTTAVNQNAGPADAAQAHTNLPPFKVVKMWERTA